MARVPSSRRSTARDGKSFSLRPAQNEKEWNEWEARYPQWAKLSGASSGHGASSAERAAARIASIVFGERGGSVKSFSMYEGRARAEMSWKSILIM